ncbi:threonine/serine exporter family protein [Arthrobacter cryoconiti]|uniref:threonine/serine ThrE exporter family protein n=1 Tax=Arthrobacter cryoconiti TaxID=748907 RepID=UPI001E61DB01|nr:threonine/serine exporter family protein [Arthrobacter cryoconiti]MCC9066795.1 threonine/serine exporter family protein [Arthrobacter cryoconiti]
MPAPKPVPKVSSKPAPTTAAKPALKSQAKTQPKISAKAQAKSQAKVHAKAQPLTPAQARANESARRVLRRLVQGEAPPTAPMNIVDRLAGSPYANPMIQVGQADESARKTIDFALRLAETMFRYGAGALEVETSIIAVTAAFGLRNIEVDITNQSVIINYAHRDGVPITVLRVVRSWTNNYAGLVEVHELVTDIVGGGLPRSDAYHRLDVIIKRPKPFPRWMVAWAEAVFAAAVVGVIGGTIFGMLVALLTILMAGQVARVMGKWRVPDFFVTAISSFIVTAVAVLCFMFHAPLSPSVVVAGGILLMLPSGRLVSAVQDAINGFPVTAAGRFLSAFLTFGAIVAGIAVALVTSALFGASRLDVAEPIVGSWPLYVVVPLVAVATVAICIAEQTSVKLLLPTMGVALAGYLSYYVGMEFGLGGRFAPAVAAIVVGVLSRVIALRMRAPQLVVAVPSIIFLLVGLSIFRAMFVMTLTPEDSVTGAVGIFNALVVILAVAAGVVLGDNIARPLTRTNGNKDRRRNRRR